MRKDNPHIPKRRGGRKQTHRRFSLQAFHYKHRHHHDHDHDHELSKTPEESTNSAEGVAIQMEASSCGGEERTPTVTFKPGHKSFSWLMTPTRSSSTGPSSSSTTNQPPHVSVSVWGRPLGEAARAHHLPACGGQRVVLVSTGPPRAAWRHHADAVNGDS